jgi:excisionase family DNA binding protein
VPGEKLTVRQVADGFGLREDTVRRLIREGRIPAVRDGGGTRAPWVVPVERLAEATVTLDSASESTWIDFPGPGDGIRLPLFSEDIAGHPLPLVREILRGSVGELPAPHEGEVPREHGVDVQVNPDTIVEEGTVEIGPEATGEHRLVDRRGRAVGPHDLADAASYDLPSSRNPAGPKAQASIAIAAIRAEVIHGERKLLDELPPLLAAAALGDLATQIVTGKDDDASIEKDAELLFARLERAKRVFGRVERMTLREIRERWGDGYEPDEAAGSLRPTSRDW